jgi:hypothetical protein
MGKIIRNGINYSGTCDNATNINYDNSISGLNARTAQEAIDELSESSMTSSDVVDNLESDRGDLPLSARQGKILNESLGEQPTFVYDENGKITGYTTKIGGADSVFPFSASDYLSMLYVYSKGTSTSATFKCSKDTTALIILFGHQYQSSGTITINNTPIYTYGSSQWEVTPFLQNVELKKGDVINIILNTGAFGSTYGLLSCVLHNGGIY